MRYIGIESIRLLGAVAALLAIGAIGHPVASDLTGFRKGPYLINPADPTTMTVLWQAHATTAGTLEWGADTTYAMGSALTTEYGDDHQHVYTIEDLQPATHYHYQVTVEGIPFAGSFRTAPPLDADALKFIVHGDVQTGIGAHNNVCEGIFNTYHADPAFQSLILAVGDLTNYGAVEADWDQLFFNPIREFNRRRLADVPFHSAMGNHDFYETAWTWDLEGTVFKKYFPYPYVDDRYWSFDYGPAHFVIADLYPWYHEPGIPDTTMPGFISSEQADWLDQDLAATDKDWKFVILHEGGWSAGPHPNNPSVQDTLHPLCLTHDVDIVFAGHNHYYLRAEVDGVPYITTSGGANLYTPDPEYPNIVVSNRNHHFCKIEIEGAVLEFTAVRPNGDLMDAFTIVKNTAVGSVPVSAPAGVRLHQNHPNPFNPSTTIRYDVPVLAPVNLTICSPAGRVVRLLVDERAQIPGRYRVEWDGCNERGRAVASGVYYYRMRSGGVEQTRAMTLVR